MTRKINKAYYYLAPALILIGIFVIYPLLGAIFQSFHDKQGNLSLETYQYVFTNTKYHKAILNTLLYTLITTPITITLSLFISYLLSLKIKFKNTFQVLFFLPYVTSTIAIGLVWSFMYHTDYGLFNALIVGLGGTAIPWLSSASFAMISLILFGIWKALAFNILILFTALSSVDDNLDKAALVDGTSSFKTFYKIKLPQIYPVLAYLIIIGLIHSLKVYEEVVSLFGPINAGPDNSAITLVYYIQQNIVTDPYVASVAAVSLLGITLILTLFNNKFTKYFSRRKR